MKTKEENKLFFLNVFLNFYYSREIKLDKIGSEILLSLKYFQTFFFSFHFFFGNLSYTFLIFPFKLVVFKFSVNPFLFLKNIYELFSKLRLSLKRTIFKFVMIFLFFGKPYNVRVYLINHNKQFHARLANFATNLGFNNKTLCLYAFVFSPFLIDIALFESNE